MKDIVIYGFGGFGREIACVIDAINEKERVWNLLGFIDDGVEMGTGNRYGTVLGNFDFIQSYPKPLALVMAIASPSTIEHIVSRIDNRNIEFPNIIAPNVLFFDKESNSFGKGNVVTFGGRISCGVSMGDFNLINGCVSFGHDVEIGNYNVMQPEVRISGETRIGNLNFWGMRSGALQGLKIGNSNSIGAGSMVMRSIKNDARYFGVPAKLLKDF